MRTEYKCHLCKATFFHQKSYGAHGRTKVFCIDCLEQMRGFIPSGPMILDQWHNVKPTPPGTVKMLTAMSEEIERYLEAKVKQ